MGETKRVFKEDYYYVYCKLAEGHNFPALHYDSVDEIFIYEQDEEVMYTCLLWNTYSNMCLLGFPVSNLSIPTEQREGMLTKFIKGIEDWCKEEGYKIIWTTSATDRVIKTLEELGFGKGDENVQTYIKVVS